MTTSTKFHEAARGDLPARERDVSEPQRRSKSDGIQGFAALTFTVICLLWAGMALGISFLEAPVMFTAPSLTLAVGLDVGRHVFGAFQKFQAALLFWLAGAAIFARLGRNMWVLLTVVGVCLALQMLWLYPVMDARVTRIMAGQTPSSAPYHVFYIALEVLKTLLLIGIGTAMARHNSRVVPAVRFRA